MTNGYASTPQDAQTVEQRVFQALDGFRIEVPSWGFANTGTRFGKFVQPAAATTIEEKFADASEVNRLTGAAPTVALHVLWDMPGGVKDAATIRGLEKKYGVRAGSINPNLFQAQEYKFGSICNPNAEIRRQALDHLRMARTTRGRRAWRSGWGLWKRSSRRCTRRWTRSSGY
jgi:L-rhamnose isomerase/sugar isomerase